METNGIHHSHSIMLQQLENIEAAFGENANLYTDVLQVDQSADTNKLQQRYLERWHEMKKETKFARTTKEQDLMNKKIDALHSTFKILVISRFRIEYDQMLQEEKTDGIDGKNENRKLVVDNEQDAFFNPCCSTSSYKMKNLLSCNMKEAKNGQKSPRSVVKYNTENESPCDVSLDESLIGEFMYRIF